MATHYFLIVSVLLNLGIAIVYGREAWQTTRGLKCRLKCVSAASFYALTSVLLLLVMADRL
ncbi:hypothetical protein GCM10027578_21040 [Spirosoma luteolum]